MRGGDEGEWETDDEEVEEEVELLLEVAAAGADGIEAGRFIDMPDFELCGDVELMGDADREGQDGGEGGGEEDDFECAMFI